MVLAAKDDVLENFGTFILFKMAIHSMIKMVTTESLSVEIPLNRTGV